jgi:hypothetical protein
MNVLGAYLTRSGDDMRLRARSTSGFRLPILMNLSRRETSSRT